MAAPSVPIQFFDIASGPPVRTYAPNPWKTRYALNMKMLSYTTTWIELPDVKSTRIKHSVAPVRKLAQDEDFYTLPMIHDPSTDTWIGDSFDIAVYLDEKYCLDGHALFPPHTIGIHRVFNAHVDALFTKHVGLCSQGMPFNPATADISKDEFVRRARAGGWPAKGWEDFCFEGEKRREMLKAFEADLEEFAKMYKVEGGPFLEGNWMSYADICVGAWLAMMKETLTEWEELCQWQDGRWRKLHEALSEWAEIK